MNGYLYSRAWFNFRFENPDLCRSIHTELYLYLVDKWNRLGQKKKFGLPTEKTMEVLNIGSYNTYKKALNDLVNFGFVEIVKNSNNQHYSKVVALSKSDEPSDKPLDKASDEPSDKPTDTIIEQKNKRTKELIEYLNDKSGKSFKTNTKSTVKILNARLKEYNAEDIKKVIDLKCEEWKHNSKMNNYLRPETLFNATKFESYYQQTQKKHQPLKMPLPVL